MSTRKIHTWSTLSNKICHAVSSTVTSRNITQHREQNVFSGCIESYWYFVGSFGWFWLVLLVVLAGFGWFWLVLAGVCAIPITIYYIIVALHWAYRPFETSHAKSHRQPSTQISHKPVVLRYIVDGFGWFWLVLAGFGWFHVLVTTPKD